VANASLLLTDAFAPALASRLLTGVAVAGVYPPAMKMASTWFRERRGLAIGAIVGALTAGKALPYLLGGTQVSLETAVLVPSAGALVAAVAIASAYRDGPHAFPARPFSWHLAGSVVREKRLRGISGGYFGHMWELYAFWAWIPAFLAASAQATGAEAPISLWAFATVAIGAAGCIWGGWAADRVGRPRVVRIALWVSGSCCLLSALLFNAPFWMVVLLSLVWGVAVIADSAQFSALVTENAPPHAVGTALTLQTSVGFLLTIASIQLLPVIANAVGWRWTMVVLALGPAAGLAAVGHLGRSAPQREPLAPSSR
jgi:MFS family permease